MRRKDEVKSRWKEYFQDLQNFKGNGEGDISFLEKESMQGDRRSETEDNSGEALKALEKGNSYSF